jgi:ERCC4-related helicase
VFRRALVDQAYLTPKSFSLIVFDECHNVTGNSPMAAILQDSVHKNTYVDGVVELPRILGLTASFVNGSLAKIENKRKKLEILMQANIFCPCVTTCDIEDEREYHNVPVSWGHMIFNIHEDGVKQFTSRVFESVPLFCQMINIHVRDKWIARGWMIFQTLGSDGFYYWLREGIVLQLKATVEDLSKRIEDPTCVRLVQRYKNIMSAMSATAQLLTGKISKNTISSDVDSLIITIPSPLDSYRFDVVSPKFTALVDLLKRLYNSMGDDNTFRGIVFVEQVAITYPLAWAINRQFSDFRAKAILSKPVDSRQAWPMLPISGAGSMLDRTRTTNLELFKSRDVPLLVSTSAIEEGIDIPDCQFIVMFDSIHTTKSQIQRRLVLL